MTESESETEDFKPKPSELFIHTLPDSQITPSAVAMPHTKGSPPSSTESETESDSEIDTPANPVLVRIFLPFVLFFLSCLERLKPRPGFPLASAQAHLGPFVLDRDKKIMVPAAINTYLRDYQRDGVRFLWRQYTEGRGGLLGDDMGLVRCLWFICALL